MISDFEPIHGRYPSLFINALKNSRGEIIQELSTDICFYLISKFYTKIYEAIESETITELRGEL
jgi:hypothetical protein